MSNVIGENTKYLNFSPDHHDQIAMMIKSAGVKRIEELLIHMGYHPSFARAAIRRIIRHRGW